MHTASGEALNMSLFASGRWMPGCPEPVPPRGLQSTPGSLLIPSMLKLSTLQRCRAGL